MKQAFCQFNPAPQTAGQGSDSIAAALRQLGPIQDLLDSLSEPATAQTVELSVTGEILRDTELQVETIGLEHNANQATNPMWILRRVPASNLHLALVRQQKRAQDSEDSRLATPVRAQQGHNLILFDGEADLLDGLTLPVVETDLLDVNIQGAGKGRLARGLKGFAGCHATRYSAASDPIQDHQKQEERKIGHRGPEHVSGRLPRSVDDNAGGKPQEQRTHDQRANGVDDPCHT